MSGLSAQHKIQNQSPGLQTLRLVNFTELSIDFSSVYKRKASLIPENRRVDLRRTPLKSILPSVSDDVDILGIFLKTLGVVLVFFCLAACICHSLKRGCFHTKSHSENKWVKGRRTWNLWRNFFLFTDLLLFFFFFSYNWPGPNNGAEYGEADEVEEGSPIWCCGSSRCRFLLTVFFTGSLSPQVFVRHLTGDTRWREGTTGAWTWSVMLWKVLGVIWHIILWCTWKLSQTTCQSIFSVNVFLYCIIFLNNEDFYFASSLFFCSLTFFWSRIQTISKRSTSLFLLSRVVEKKRLEAVLLFQSTRLYSC